jgi:hypothetical protein
LACCARYKRDEIAQYQLLLGEAHNFQSLAGKHPMTRCQHVLRVELRLRCVDGLPGRSVVALPIILRHRNCVRPSFAAVHESAIGIELPIQDVRYMSDCVAKVAKQPL